jgi:hypothetical protein
VQQQEDEMPKAAADIAECQIFWRGGNRRGRIVLELAKRSHSTNEF